MKPAYVLLVIKRKATAVQRKLTFSDTPIFGMFRTQLDCQNLARSSALVTCSRMSMSGSSRCFDVARIISSRRSVGSTQDTGDAWRNWLPRSLVDRATSQSRSRSIRTHSSRSGLERMLTWISHQRLLDQRFVSSHQLNCRSVQLEASGVLFLMVHVCNFASDVPRPTQSAC